MFKFTQDEGRHEGQFSEWFRVLSGVPQGLTFGPLLFLVFVSSAVCVCSLMIAVQNCELAFILKEIHCRCKSTWILDKFVEWSSKWQQRFIPSQCKVVHIGNLLQSSIDTEYSKYHVTCGCTKVVS